MRATETAYKELQQAFDFFNARLFNGELPDCLITFQRGKNTMGYFSPKRFIATDGSGLATDEIALNPEYFPSYPLIEVMQTLVHEQCHMWQFHFGKPSRAGYHNQEWADKMESIGLMPSSTGCPGGAKVGQGINDYPMPGGAFQRVTLELFQGDFALSWFDRLPAPVEPKPELSSLMEEWRETLASTAIDNDGNKDVETLLEMALVAPVSTVQPGNDTSGDSVLPGKPKNKNKTTYVCPRCKVKIWGKPTINVLCGDCEIQFEAVKGCDDE